MLKVDIPLFIDLPRKTKKDKRVYLNLNVYRNLHHQLNNQAKIQFKTSLYSQLMMLGILQDPITIKYTLYPKTKRLCDTSNICCVVDKFFCDALVEFAVIPDDTYKNVTSVTYTFGGVDKENPRVTAEIEFS